MTKSHENDNDDDDFKHVCIIAVFLLIKLLYLLIHSLDYLFRSIQTLAVLMSLIDLVVMSSLITCCLLNLPLKLTFSQCHFLKQLSSNTVSVMLIVFSTFKCFIKFLKYMIAAK